MKFNKKIILWIVIPLILLILIGAGIRWTRWRVEQGLQPPSEMLVQVERGDLEVWVTGSGTVQPAREEAVRSSVSGTIETYLLEEGKEVVAGEQLVTLSYQDLSLEIKIARINLDIQELELDNLKEQEQTDQVKHQVSLAELRLEQARLELAELERRQRDNRAYSVITAPAGGTVVLPELNTTGAGVNVSPGMVLATIVDYTDLEIIAPVDELDINRVAVGQQAEVTVEALPGVTIAGELVKVASRGEMQGGVATFDVTVAIEPVDGLRAGMNAGVAILVDTRSDTLLVPIEAVFEEEGESMVMVAGEDRETERVDFRPARVVTGAYDAAYIEILSGVREGQQIVIRGADAGLMPQGGMMGDFGPRPGGDR